MKSFVTILSGGVSASELNFKYNLGDHIEQVVWNWGATREEANTLACTITKRGYKQKYRKGIYTKYYWLDVDGIKSPFSGWYGEDDITNNNNNWVEVSSINMVVVDSL